MTSQDIIEALRSLHPKDEWLFFPEFRSGVGYGPKAEHRIDALAMSCWCKHTHGQARNYRRIAYEIKISRSDFAREIKNPEKRQMAFRIANQFYFVVPQGLLKADEVPSECGLIEVLPSGGCKTIRDAPYYETPEPSWNLIAAFARRIGREERG